MKVGVLLEKEGWGSGLERVTGTPLGGAASRGLEEVIHRLLQEGTNINRRGKDGRSALDIAACAGHEAIVRLLLDKGADVNSQYPRPKNRL